MTIIYKYLWLQKKFIKYMDIDLMTPTWEWSKLL